MQDNDRQIHISGASVGRDVNTDSGAFIGRDNYIYGDEVYGNKVMGDQITSGNIEGIGIAIGKDASVQIFGDIHYYPIKLRVPLRKVFDPLIEDRTKIFGGRERILAKIAEFIKEPQGGYLVITAPAGFGKTALLANLVNRNPTAFAYHFFTPLYGDSTLNEDFFLRNVVEQMAQWHGYKELLPTRLEELRALYQQFVAQPLEYTQILVVDGLDEVTRWKLAPYLSRRLPERLHIIVSSRVIGQDGLIEYQFPIDQFTLLPLDGLYNDEVAQVLRSAGNDAFTFADDPKLLDEVMRVAAYTEDEQSGVDPFYVRLLAEDIAVGKLNATNIAQQPQGLEKYLDTWWQQIKQLAGEQPTRDLFGTLTVALGPIGRAELEAMSPTLVDAWSKDFLDDVLREIQRWIVGNDERGYALAHPRLRDYMRTRIKTDFYLEKMLAYCANWQSNNSCYALSYYSKHLSEAKKRNDLYALIDKSWMNANFAMTNSHYNFVWDVELAIELASEDSSPEGLVQLVRGCLIWATLSTMVSHVPRELYRVLVQTGQDAKAYGFAVSIKDPDEQSQAYLEIAQALLISAGKSDRVEFLIEEALETIEEIEDEPNRTLSLLQVIGVLVQLGDLDQVLQIVEEIENLSLKVSALHLLVRALVQSGDMNRAWQTVEIIEDENEKASLSCTLAQELAKIGAVEQALQAVEGIKNRYYNAQILCEVAKIWRLAGEKDKALQVSDHAAQIAKTIDEGISRTEALIVVAQTLIEMDEKEKSIELITYAIQAAEAAEEGWLKTNALKEVAFMLLKIGKNDLAIEVANRVLKIIEVSGEDAVQTKSLSLLIRDKTNFYLNQLEVRVALEALKVLVQVGQTEHTLKVVEAIEDEQVKTNALTNVVIALAESGQIGLAVEVTKKIKEARPKAKMFSIVAEEFIKADKKTEAMEMVNRAVQAAEAVGDELLKVAAQSVVAGALAQYGKIDEAWEVVTTVQSMGYQTAALSEVALVLAQTEKVEAILQLVNTIRNKRIKMDVLSEIVEGLGYAEKTQLALQITQTIVDITYRVLIMSRLIRVLSKIGDKANVIKYTNRGLKMTLMLKNENIRSVALGNIVLALMEINEKTRVINLIDQEWSRIVVMRDTRSKVNLLSVLALAASQLGEKTKFVEITNYALEVTQNIKNPKNKVRELGAIAEVFVHIGEKTQVEKLISIAIESTEQIFDMTDKMEALAGLVEMLIQAGDNLSAEVVTAHALQITDKDRYNSDLIQTSKAELLARVGRVDDALRAIQVIRFGTFRALGLSKIAYIMEESGQHRLAEQALRRALTTLIFNEYSEGLANRDLIFSILGFGAKLIAAIDQGETLWRAYQAIIEVESWWSGKSPIITEHKISIDTQINKLNGDSNLVRRLLSRLFCYFGYPMRKL